MYFNSVLEVTKMAGEIVKEGFGKSFNIEFKTNETNLVTDIDKKSEKCIIDYIQQHFPTHNILAEESGELSKSSEFTWVIDPLDGTTNFAHGFPIFSVSIGLQKKGKTVAGAVYDVMRDKLYGAELGNGAYCNGEPITVSKEFKLGRSLVVTGFPYDIAENPENALGIFVNLVRSSRGIRRLGSAAIDLCYVAEGVFEAFWEVNLHPWDICAGKLIVEEAGGLVTGFAGEKTDIFTKKVLATNRFVLPEIVEAIRKGADIRL